MQARLIDWWRQSPYARTLLTIGAVLCLAVGILWMTVGASTQEELLLGGHTFQAEELTTAEAIWAKQGLQNYRIENSQVRVPSGQQPAYLAALADAGAVPHDFSQDLLELSTEISPFLSQAARDDSMQIAKQNMLAQIIRRMQGIDNAWVVIDRTTQGGLRREAVLSASVSIQAKEPLAREQILQIQQLIAGAIAGMSPGQVSVIDLNSTDSVAMSGESQPPGLAMLQAYENHYRKLVAQTLSQISECVINIRAEYPAELNSSPDQSRTPQTDEVLMNQGNLRVSEKSMETTTAEPKLAAVAIGLPQAYLEQRWKQHQSQMSGSDLDRQAFEQQEIESIQQTVSTVLSDSPATQIRVYTIPTQQAVATSPEGESVAMYLQLALAGILLLGGMVLIHQTWWRNRNAEESPEGPSDSLHAQLKQRVKEDPQQAAVILQQWLHPIHSAETKHS